MPESPTSGSASSDSEGRKATVEASVYIPLANGKRERESESPDNAELAAAGEMDPCLPIKHKEQQSLDEIDSAPLKVKSKLHSSNNSLNKKRKAKGAEDTRKSRFILQLEEKLRQKSGLSRLGLIVAGVVILLLLVFLIVIISLAATWPRTPHAHLFPVCTRAACLQASAQVSQRHPT